MSSLKPRVYIDGWNLPEDCEVKLKTLVKEDRMEHPGWDKQFRLIPSDHNEPQVCQNVLFLLPQATLRWSHFSHVTQCKKCSARVTLSYYRFSKDVMSCVCSQRPKELNSLRYAQRLSLSVSSLLKSFYYSYCTEVTKLANQKFPSVLSLTCPKEQDTEVVSFLTTLITTFVPR